MNYSSLSENLLLFIITIFQVILMRIFYRNHVGNITWRSFYINTMFTHFIENVARFDNILIVYNYQFNILQDLVSIQHNLTI